uniref:Reverse transcriptase Ty1/copia-type domain-containing protein n=1 Tax=Peronospora matthiolae TaxID=2874970 RepID=A0AAV1TIB8_9STRA
MVVVRLKEPRSVKEAMTLPERQKWIDAMKAELDALVENGTWKVVDEPKKGTNIVDSKWVLKIKFDADGDVERIKARLVAREFIQNLLGLLLTHGDVPNAYVKSLLREVIYMKALRELDVEAGKVLKLLKPLYGP